MKICLSLLLLCCLTGLHAQLHMTEQLLHGTIRIETSSKSGITTGTGFFFNFYADTEKKIPIPVIITNKHVVNGSDMIRLFFRKVKDNKPDYDAPFIVSVPNNANTVIQHPDKDIDLVAIPVAPIYEELDKKNISIFSIASNENRIPDDSTQRADLKPVEEVWMIGCPDGLWDTKNNMPVVRSGVTATIPYFDYNGRKEFLVDIPALSGSSGSPVFYYRDMYIDKNYAPKIGAKLFLLGILYAGPLYNDGKATMAVPGTNAASMNMGYIIKASELFAFKKILLAK